MTKTTHPPEELAVIDRMKAEVLRDIAEGIVPANVASYSDLHDHVDANEYGGACEQDPDVGYVGLTDEQVAFWDRCQGAVDAWLKAGGHRCAARTYRSEFGPGYLTPEQASELAALGLVDTSWHNDACPRFATPDDTLAVWIEHENPDKRETSSARFTCSVKDKPTDDPSEARDEFVTAEFPNLIEWLKTRTA